MLRSFSARRITFFLIFAAAAAAVQASAPSPVRAVTLAQVDGGPNYYAKFSHGLPTKRSHFPIGVWLESVLSQADVDKDKAAGLNTYLTLTSNSNLGLVQANGMHAIVQSDEFGPHQAAEGWFLADEVDMTHGPPTGYAEMQRVADATAYDGRVRYSGYGKGVLFWDSDAEAARFVNNYQDIVQADAYFFTDNDVCDSSQAGGEPGIVETDHCHVASNYGWIIDRLEGLISPPRSKPVWAVVELGHPFSESDWPTITPPQVRAAVWQSLIAGARGIVYFNHSFGGPDQTQHILRDGSQAGSVYAPIRSVVTATNGEIRALAPVLNSPTVISPWSQGPGTTAMVKWVEGGTPAKKRCKSKGKTGKKKGKKCKKAKGKKASKNKKKACKSKKGKKCEKANKTKGQLYVFAGSAGSPVEGRFSLPCVGNAHAAVVGENRTVPVRNGTFSDRFADGNAIHIYRIDARCGAGTPRHSTVTPLGLPASGDSGISSNNLARIILATMAIILLCLLASFGITHRPGRGPRPSGKRPKRAHHLGAR